MVEEIPTLEVSLDGFSMTNYMNRILFLTGGVNKNEFSDRVYAFNVENVKWQSSIIGDQIHSKLNVGRNSHSSLCIGGKVYVVCGYDGQQTLSSVELLDMEN